MTNVIAASGSKAEVLEQLRQMQLAHDDRPTVAKLLGALADHVDFEVDGGNKSIDVAVSIKYGMG